MKLTPRQAARVNDIIQAEVQSVLAERRAEPMNVDMSIMNQVIEEKMYDTAVTSASEVVNSFRRKVMKQIIDQMNQHAMSHRKVRANELEDDVFLVEPELADLEEELAMEITTALHNFARKLGGAAVRTAGGNEPDETGY